MSDFLKKIAEPLEDVINATATTRLFDLKEGLTEYFHENPHVWRTALVRNGLAYHLLTAIGRAAFGSEGFEDFEAEVRERWRKT